jgi:hypothetical protein
VDSALNGSAATTVAAQANAGDTIYIIGFDSVTPPANGQLYHLTSEYNGSWDRLVISTGVDTFPWTMPPYGLHTRIFAIFTDTNPAQVSVPGVVGQSEAAAIADIENADLVAVVNEEPSDTVTTGDVIRQNPEVDTMVDARSEVTIVVSLGVQPEQASVPNVLGMSQAAAVEAIEAVSLVAVVDERSSETVEPGLVFGQNPLENTLLNVGSMVTIQVSTGSAPETAVIFDPDDSSKAIGIDNLFVSGMFYDVAFTTSTTADTVYGTFPGSFNVTAASAELANDAVNAALNGSPATTVGDDEMEGGANLYAIGYGSLEFFNAETLAAWSSDFEAPEWSFILDGDLPLYNIEERVFAVFTPAPEPSMSLLMVAALAALGGVAGWRQSRQTKR